MDKAREELRDKIVDFLEDYLFNRFRLQNGITNIAMEMADALLSFLPDQKSGVEKVLRCLNCSGLPKMLGKYCDVCHGTGEIETELTKDELCEWAMGLIEDCHIDDIIYFKLPDGSRLRRRRNDKN